MKTDYGELKGTRIHFIVPKHFFFQEQDRDGVVVDAHYHVGVTIVDAKDKDKEIFCLNRKVVVARSSIKIYRKMFHETIKQIRSGEVNGLKLTLLSFPKNYTFGGSGKIADCAFK